MVTVVIEENSPQAKKFLAYARTLPFVTVVEAKKKSFRAAVAECNGRPASEFFEEMRRQAKERFKNA